MPFDISSIPDQNLASVLEKVGLKSGHRIIRANKGMFARAKHIRTQFRLYGNEVDVAMKEDGDLDAVGYQVIDSEFRYHLNKISVTFYKIYEAEDYSKYFADFDNVTCKSLEILHADFSPAELDAVQELASNKLLPQTIQFSIPRLDSTSTWTKPIPSIVMVNYDRMDELFWSMQNFTATPYMCYNILPRDDDIYVSVLQQIIQKWRDGGLASARKWFRIIFFRHNDVYACVHPPLTAELIKERFANLWTAFQPQEVTEILHVEAEIGSPALVRPRVDKSSGSGQNMDIIFSGAKWEIIQIDLFPNYDPQFEYSFPK